MPTYKSYVNVNTLIVLAIIVASVLLALILLTDYAKFAIIGAIVCVWVVLNINLPFAGLLVYVAFILVRPNEFIGVMGLPMVEKVLVAPVLLGMILVLIQRQRSRASLHTLDKAILAFAAVALLSIPLAIWQEVAFAVWMDVIRLVIVYVLVSRLVTTNRQLQALVAVVIMSAGFHAVSATIRYYSGVRQFKQGIDRAFGMDLSYGDPNSLAATIAYTLPLMYYSFRGARNRLVKASLFFLMAASMWCIIITGSRAGMAAVIFIVFLTMWDQKDRVRNMAIAAVILIVGAIAMPDQYKERFATMFDPSYETAGDAGLKGRIAGLTEGIKMFVDRPIVGVGIGMYPIYRGGVLGTGYWQSHNQLGQLIGELGLLGLIAFIVWMAVLFKRLKWLRGIYRREGPAGRFAEYVTVALRIEILTLLFVGLSAHNLYRYNWYIISAITGAMIFMAREKLKAEQNETARESTLPEPEEVEAQI